MVLKDGDDFLAFLMFIAGVANTITAFFGHRVGAVAMQNAQIELLVMGQMPHTGDESMCQ